MAVSWEESYPRHLYMVIKPRSWKAFKWAYFSPLTEEVRLTGCPASTLQRQAKVCWTLVQISASTTQSLSPFILKSGFPWEKKGWTGHRSKPSSALYNKSLMLYFMPDKPVLPSSPHPLIQTVAICRLNYTNPSNPALSLVNELFSWLMNCLFADQIQWLTNTLLKAFHRSNVRILLCQGGSSKKTTFSAVAGLVSSIISDSLLLFLTCCLWKNIWSCRSALLRLKSSWETCHFS